MYKKRLSVRNKKMRGGTSYVAATDQSIENNGAPVNIIGRTIPFNTSTGEAGVDPLAVVNITNSRLIPQQNGGKKRRRTKRSKKSSRKTRRRRMRGGIAFSSIDAIPDFFLGPRTGMNQVTSFGSTAGGTLYTENQLTGKGNLDGPSLIPNMGPPSQAKV
jgi:hypothetical protein